MPVDVALVSVCIAAHLSFIICYEGFGSLHKGLTNMARQSSLLPRIWQLSCSQVLLCIFMHV